MSTSPFSPPAWDDEDYELLGQDAVSASAPLADEPWEDEAYAPADRSDYGDEVYEDPPEGPGAPLGLGEHLRSTEYVAMPGMPGRGVVLTTGVATGCVAALDFALTGGLTIFFDLCFVVICLVAAMAVRRHDLFSTAVLPPLVYAATIGAVAVLAPTTFVEASGLSKTFMTGLTGHAGALVAGYAVALVTVGGRVASTPRR